MPSTPIGLSSDVVNLQLEFFRRGNAGCVFAAVAATNPSLFGWSHHITAASCDTVNDSIAAGIAAPKVNMVSLLFPDVSTHTELIKLIETLRRRTCISIGMDEVYGMWQCIGLRLPFDGKQSWITGMGPFDFLPKTRRAPTTELIMRVKPRPAYAKVMKEAPSGVVHLADLDMLGMMDVLFKQLWNLSLRNTARILGRKPDLCSAAKTTFALPLKRH